MVPHPTVTMAHAVAKTQSSAYHLHPLSPTLSSVQSAPDISRPHHVELALRVEPLQGGGGVAGSHADQSRGLVREQHQQVRTHHRSAGVEGRLARGKRTEAGHVLLIVEESGHEKCLSSMTTCRNSSPVHTIMLLGLVSKHSLQTKYSSAFDKQKSK